MTPLLPGPFALACPTITTKTTTMTLAMNGPHHFIYIPYRIYICRYKMFDQSRSDPWEKHSQVPTTLCGPDNVLSNLRGHDRSLLLLPPFDGPFTKIEPVCHDIISTNSYIIAGSRAWSIPIQSKPQNEGPEKRVFASFFWPRCRRTICSRIIHHHPASSPPVSLFVTHPAALP
jgi:hypothetical protein